MELLDKLDYMLYELNNVIDDIYYHIYLEKFDNMFLSNVKRDLVNNLNIKSSDVYNKDVISNKILKGFKLLEDLSKFNKSLKNFKTSNIEIEVFQTNKNINPEFSVSVICGLTFKPDYNIIKKTLADWNYEQEEGEFETQDVLEDLQTKSIDEITKFLKNKTKKLEVNSDGFEKEEYSVLVEFEFIIR